MILAHSHRRVSASQRYGCWRPLGLWQRLMVLGALLGVLASAAGLIYFAPNAPLAPSTSTAAPGRTASAS